MSPQGVQEGILFFPRKFCPPVQFNAFTYYSADTGCLSDCPLPVEMMYPDSKNDIDIETFSMIGKQMEIAVNTTLD
jgi:hypothetical protein